uniref:helix-turn-helix transcriptional regulator n=1 Tax=Lentzea alba TaxID=2714351 RepID=UPI0039BF7AD0
MSGRAVPDSRLEGGAGTSDNEPPPGQLVGRDHEIGRLRGLLAALKTGRGSVVWIEGEPGVGKSALIATVLAEAAEAGCRTALAVGDQLVQGLPVRALLDGLGRAGDVAELDWDVAVGGDPVPVAVERLLSLVDRWCARAPVVLAFDDLQWADEASLLAWRELGRLADQNRLSLVSACRPVPVRPVIARLRRTTLQRRAVHLPLGPLDPTAVVALTALLAGGQPGPGLRAVATQAGGNPLYVRELVDALLRDGLLRLARGSAELLSDGEFAGMSPAGAIAARMDFLTSEATNTLRMAAVLGHGFSVSDLATVTGQQASELLPVVDEAIAAGVLAEDDDRLVFRHGLIRTALYEAAPVSARLAMHRQAAQALAEAGLPVDRVAGHLLLSPESFDGWVLDWLVDHAVELAHRVPQVAAELLHVAVERCGGEPRQAKLLYGLATALLLLNRLHDAERVARQALAQAAEPEAMAEVAWVLGRTLARLRRHSEALLVCEQVAAQPRIPAVWRARLNACRAYALAISEQGVAAKAAAERALTEGQRLADGTTTGYAALSLYMLLDYASGLVCLEQALADIGEAPETMDLRVPLLVNRSTCLDELGRHDEAEAVMGEALTLTQRRVTWRLATVRCTAGWQYLDIGRWDDAKAEFESLADEPDEYVRWVLLGGLAFIACHRDEKALTVELLAAADRMPQPTGFLLGATSHLWMARAVDAEQRRNIAQAAKIFIRTVGIEDGVRYYDRHLWLPDVVRLALAIGDADLAHAAVAAAEADVAAEQLPKRHLAARRARAVLDGDIARLMEVADDYRVVGRPLELGQTCEEAAVLLAREGERASARAWLTDAVSAYLQLGATWDVRRADGRLRQLGVRRGPRAIRHRPATGWEALTPTEQRVAELVTEGLSNPDIAAEMFLSRRTVQTHVSNALAKLGVASRTEIAREAARRNPR